MNALWRKYRDAPLSTQFVYEWIAFGVVAVTWCAVLVLLGLLGMLP